MSFRITFILVWSFALAGICNTSEAAPLTIWSVDPLQKVFPDDRPPAKTNKIINLSAGKGEYESGQGIVLADERVAELHASATSLKQAGGASISADDIRVRFVASVPITRNTPSTSPGQLICKAPCEVPDVLLDDVSIALEPGRAQPIWMTVHVPASARPGTYDGELIISAGEDRQVVPVRLEVWPFAVPAERHLQVTNWIRWPSTAAYHNVEPWSEPHWEILGRYAANWHAHRQNVVMVDIGLIDCRLDENDLLVCDYQRFDRLVELLERAGVLDRLELPFMARHGPGGWSDPQIQLRQIVAVDKDGKRVSLEPERGLKPFLEQLQRHLEQKGWLDKAVTHVCDEPAAHNLESWRAASRFIHQAAPRIARIDAIETTGFGDDLEVWVPKLNHLRNWFDHYHQAQGRGKELWFYTCCHPYGYYPNRFLDHRLIETRILHWMNWHSGTTGYLHWGLLHWSGDPFRDVGDSEHPPGDHFIIYPGQTGPLDSIRWEQMRDGIEDYECLWLLRETMKQVQQRLGPAAREMNPAEPSNAVCARIVRNFTDFVRDAGPFNEARRQLADEIVQATQSPLVMLELEPPAGTELVPGPINIIVRGVTEKGAQVTINGKETPVGDEGRFVRQFSPSGQEITIDVKTDTAAKRLTRYYPIR